jgi:Tol biopolymer transport system component
LALSPGARLGSFEIVSAIGAGGMGEVYRAKDTKLNRDVAIKVLPESFALDADRVARFTREAQVLASLNHPNIAAIYGIESSALVMELVDGEDLSTVIARGSMALADALPIAKQIADALEAAHEQGIVHRDLKPQNIKVRPDGTVKVLDFGLAKAMDPAAASSGSLANSPTMTSPAMTGMGMILGTAAYMSPEQAKGRLVDKRADIWAFGVVLYEMLCGRRAFEGDDVSDLLVAVLSKDVNLSALPATTPTSVVTLLQRCLARDPKRRLRDIGEARLQIDAVLGGGDDISASPAPAAPAGSRRRAHFAWAAVVVLAAVLSPIVVKRFDGQAPALLSRFDLPLPAKTSAFGWPEVSPDGRSIATVVAGDDGINRIWIRRIDSTTFEALAGTEGATYPFWSPNSQSIGFFADDILKQIALSGGPPVPICAAFRGRGGAWNASGTIVFSSKTSVNEAEHLWQVAATGGSAVMLTALAIPGLALQRFPHFLPDGRHYLFFASERKPETDGVYVAALGETGARRIVPGFTEARYSDGTLFFVRETTLLAQTFDPATLTLGAAEPVVLMPVAVGANEAGQAFSVSIAGVLVAVANEPAANFQLRWFDRQGQAAASVGAASARRGPRIAPDGKRVAVFTDLPRTAATGGSVGVVELGSGRYQRLTFVDAGFGAVAWSPDSSAVFFGMAEKARGISDLFRQPAASGTAIEPLLVDRSQKFPVDVSADGHLLAFLSAPTQSQRELRVLSLADRSASLFAQNVTSARLSPDGRWMAYTSIQSGRPDVFIQSFPTPGPKIQVTERGGDAPVWSRNGRELFYVAAGKLVGVPMTFPSGTPVAGQPAVLFDVPNSTDYDTAADGRFLFSVPVANHTPLAIVTLNWKTGLSLKK